MSREAAICRFLLDRFAAADRVRGGEFSTPDQIVRLMARLLAPQPGDSVYDPCCGNGGLLAGAAADLEERGEPSQRMSFTGQAISERSLRLAKINLAVHGLTTVTDLRWRSALRDDPYRAESFDVVLTNPPFNLKDWSRGDPADDSRWRYGVPPRHSANFAWLQHIAGKLSPHGRAAVLMPNATTVSANPRERGIREAMVDAGVVDSVIMLPGQLFRSTSVPVSLWLLRSRRAHDPGRVLFVDARELGVKEDRAYRELTDGDIGRIVDTYQAWRRLGAAYTGVPGFSATAAKDDIAACAYALAANSYVTPALDNGPRAEETIHRLRAELAELHDRAAAVDALAEHELREVFR